MRKFLAVIFCFLFSPAVFAQIENADFDEQIFSYSADFLNEYNDYLYTRDRAALLKTVEKNARTCGKIHGWCGIQESFRRKPRFSLSF